jgi:hypothetical protein
MKNVVILLGCILAFNLQLAFSHGESENEDTKKTFCPTVTEESSKHK